MASYNNTVHNILEKEINLLLPQIPRVEKHGIITTLVSSFIGLVYEGISSFLQNRRNKALHKAITVMDSKADIQCNKLMHLENSLLMYGVYNAETLEKLIKTVHNIHNTTTLHERLFVGQHSPSVFKRLYAHSSGLHHYSINSLIFLRMIQDKYISLSRFCKGHRFSNAVKIMIFILDVQNYVPIKLCKAAGSIHLFKIIGMLKAENIKLNKNYLWDPLEIYWKEVTVTFNDNKINLSKIVVIKLQDKIKVRRLMNRKPLLFHLMLKQGITWFTLATEVQETA